MICPTPKPDMKDEETKHPHQPENAAESELSELTGYPKSIKMSEIAMESFTIRGMDGITTITTYADGHISTGRIPYSRLVSG